MTIFRIKLEEHEREAWDEERVRLMTDYYQTAKPGTIPPAELADPTGMVQLFVKNHTDKAATIILQDVHSFPDWGQECPELTVPFYTWSLNYGGEDSLTLLTFRMCLANMFPYPEADEVLRELLYYGIARDEELRNAMRMRYPKWYHWTSWGVTGHRLRYHLRQVILTAARPGPNSIRLPFADPTPDKWTFRGEISDCKAEIRALEKTAKELLDEGYAHPLWIRVINKLIEGVEAELGRFEGVEQAAKFLEAEKKAEEEAKKLRERVTRTLGRSAAEMQELA